MLKKFELSDENNLKIKKQCEIKKINYMTSVFDQESLNFIIKKLKINTIKIPSGEITNGPLLLACAKLAKNIILSTGLSDIEDRHKMAGAIFAYPMIENAIRGSRGRTI